MAMSEPAPSEMTRDELEAELSELRESHEDLKKTVEILQKELEFFEEAVLGDYSPTATQPALDGDSMIETVLDLKAGGGGSSNGVSEAARAEMLEAHRAMIDWQDGVTDPGGSEERAVILFRQFIRNLDDDRSMTGVSSEYGKFKIKSDRATHILDEEGVLPATNPSMAKKRAMKKLVRMTVSDACECESDDASVVNCEHALFHFHNENEYVLSVDQDAWLEYVASVQSAIDGVDVDATTASATVDDAGDSPDDTVAAEEDRLANATPEHEVANTDVSGEEASVLAAGETPQEDT